MHCDYLDQHGCEQFPNVDGIDFTVLLGTSSKERTRLLFTRRANTTVRELGAHEGSSPATNNVGDPLPSAATV
jgi:hypothetical protein